MPRATIRSPRESALVVGHPGLIQPLAAQSVPMQTPARTSSRQATSPLPLTGRPNRPEDPGGVTWLQDVTGPMRRAAAGTPLPFATARCPAYGVLRTSFHRHTVQTLGVVLGQPVCRTKPTGRLPLSFPRPGVRSFSSDVGGLVLRSTRVRRDEATWRQCAPATHVAPNAARR